MATFREALGQAVSSLEEEVMQSTLKRLELSAAQLVKRMVIEYQGFFDHLQENVLNTGISGDDNALPPAFQNLGMQPWTKLSESWMQRKSAAWKKGDASALYFYRGVSNTSRKKKKSLYTYVGELAESGETNVEKFFGGMSLTFTLTQPDGRTTTVTNSSQLKSHLELVRTSRDAKGRFTKFMQGTTLTAHITAFPKIAEVMADRGIPDAALANYMGNKDTANEKQWHKFRGRIGSHRPAVIPLIQWYLEIRLKQFIKQYIF